MIDTQIPPGKVLHHASLEHHVDEVNRVLSDTPHRFQVKRSGRTTRLTKSTKFPSGSVRVRTLSVGSPRECWRSLNERLALLYLIEKSNPTR